ncbi:MAG: S9 family peptidase [Bacteroidetes bacterium]|nr:S9 family peptidase [Bacteroidota bacterium]
MKTYKFQFLFVILILLAACSPSVKQLDVENYVNAEQFLPVNSEKLVFNNYVRANFIDSTSNFWYTINTRKGKEFLEVNMETKTKKPVFDHELLASVLSALMDTVYDAYKLPFNRIELKNDVVEFTVKGKKYGFNRVFSLIAEVKEEENIKGVKSPDGKWTAYSKNHNLYIQNLNSKQEIALSSDGMAKYEYGNSYSWYNLFDLQNPALDNKELTVEWSPDSKKIATFRVDYRNSKYLYLLQSVLEKERRAKVWFYERVLVGDTALAMIEFVLFDVNTRKQTKVDIEPFPKFLYSGSMEWLNNEMLVFDRNLRGYKQNDIIEVNGINGKTRLVASDKMDTYVDVNIAFYKVLDKTRELLVTSERDGWNHLYLFDWESGELKNQVTKGNFVFKSLKYLDEENRLIYFTACGMEDERNPYLDHLYVVNFDGSGLKLLTPEDAHHEILFNKTGDLFVDNYSRVDLPTISVLRYSKTGEILMEIEQADVKDLLATGWTYPEVYKVKARDNETDIWGVIRRPSNFSAKNKYPIIDGTYSGPHAVRMPISFTNAYRSWDQSFAELGSIVVTVDGLGTAQRSKKFHDFSYKNLGDIGADDHEKAIRELAAKYKYMDIDRVGIFGHSAGGYDAARALLIKPDFYKVGVSSAGNHDQRIDKVWWNELYMGFPEGPEYEQQANMSKAANLKGKLLLIHGDMDNNVNPIETIRMANALMEANRDFDMLIIPNKDHNLYDHKFFTRKRWDYFVKNLMGAEPPTNYEIGVKFKQD